MIGAREALKSIKISEGELGELGRLENAVSPTLDDFKGIPIKIKIYTSEAAAPQSSLYISPENLSNADRIICIFKYRRQQEGWTVEIVPDCDAYGNLLAYVLIFEPSMSACLPEPAAKAAERKLSLVPYAPQQTGPGWYGDDFSLPRRPLLSVIFGTYNRIEHLQRAVASVRRSARKIDHEIIVCDGGSTDGSRRWLAEQPDIIFIGERHLDGAVKAFNQCYAVCRGEFIANLNDDCIVQGEALSVGVRYLQEHPQTGQVAFGFRGEGEEWHINEIYEPKNYPTVTWPTTYANFGITRREIAEKVTSVYGGFWNSVYKTYAADCELSAWAWKFGYTVDRLPHLRVLDTRADDQLRASNNKSSGLEAKRMYARWPAESFQKNGPDPRVSASELARFHAVRDGKPIGLVAETKIEEDLLTPIVEMIGWPHPEEERRLRKIAPVLRALDPVDEQFPKRALSMGSERVLHISMGTDADPQAGQVRALKKLGGLGYKEIRWYADYGGDQTKRQTAILEAAAELKPTLIFGQFQVKNAIDEETAKQLRIISDPKCVIATWSGDIASENSPWSVDWQTALGRLVDLNLHSSLSHVRAMRAAGLHNSGYLQIGYDEQDYNPASLISFDYDVCFLGSRYGNGDAFSKSMPRHDAGLRDEVVSRMQEALGGRFGLFGSGWNNGGKTVSLSNAHEIYWNSKIGLNVSLANFLDCYTSDRLHRILGCGSLLLTKRFPKMSTYGLKHDENCLVWDAPDQAVALAKEVLVEPDRLAAIASAGAKLAREHLTWGARMLELAPYLDAVRAAR